MARLTWSRVMACVRQLCGRDSGRNGWLGPHRPIPRPWGKASRPAPGGGSVAPTWTGHGMMRSKAWRRTMREGPERIPVVVADTYDEIAHRIAARLAEIIRERRAAGRCAVLGLATGSTPIGIYRELIRRHREEGLDFSHVVTFNLDEYYPMPPDSLHSYHRF